MFSAASLALAAVIVAQAPPSSSSSSSASSSAAPSPATGVKGHAKVRVLVLDFKHVGVSEGEATLLRDAAASRLGKDEKLEVISAGEMKTLVDVEASKQSIGDCDPASAQACLAEIAGALGADYVVAGNVGKLGDSVVINVSLLDSKTAEAVARDTITAPTLDDALVSLGGSMDKLADALRARLDTPSVSPTLLVGGALAGVGVVVGGVGGVWSAMSEYTLESRDGKPADKQTALDNRALSLGALGVGVGLVVAGGVLIGVAEALQ